MSRPSTLAVALLLPLALTRCDAGLDPTPPAAPTATASLATAGEAALVGRVAFESEDFLPVPGAQVVVEVVDADPAQADRDAPPIELVTDDGGWFRLERLPIEDGELVFHVFVDGEHGGQHVVKVVRGKPTEKLLGIIVVTAWMACVVTAWASGAKVAGTDKMRHCVASCRATRWCGGAITGWTAGVLKELFDSLCQAGPQWVKDLLQPVSGCSGWDNADLAADGRGISCAYKWKSCEKCCDDYY